MIEQYGGVYIPNLANTAEKYGIGEYRFAHNYELAGKKLTIVADGKEYPVKFTDCEKAEFGGKKVEWEAEKLNAALYFVRLGADSVVLCLEKGKAVLCLHDRKTPLCGTIKGKKCDEVPAPVGDDMVGTNVRWTFGVNRYVDHEYFAKGKVRRAWSKNTVMAGNRRTFRDGWEPQPEDYDVEDIKAVHFGGPFYVVDITAKIPEGCCAPAGVKHIVLLEDYDRCMTVGCAFGPAIDPIMLAGYAKFLN